MIVGQWEGNLPEDLYAPKITRDVGTTVAEGLAAVVVVRTNGSWHFKTTCTFSKKLPQACSALVQVHPYPFRASVSVHGCGMVFTLVVGCNIVAGIPNLYSGWQAGHGTFMFGSHIAARKE